jgi:glucose-1-phosphate cytidylyltransferase
MKVAILAGGTGSRLSEETVVKPKPMVEIGGRPLLWHIMKYYAHWGHNDFTIALGYKGDYVKRYFVEYSELAGDVTVSLRDGVVTKHRNGAGLEDWKVRLCDTGLHSETGGRIKRLAPFLNDGTFMLTWGDGVANVDLDRLLAFHRAHGRIATLTAVRPPARFGHLELDDDRISEFSEKPQTGEGWINGAFFVLEPEIFDYIEGDDTRFEREPLERLAADDQLMAYRHYDYWQCMDTLREKMLLEELWATSQAPWKLWS